MNDFLVASTEDLFVVRGTDRYGDSFEWGTHDRAEATEWAAGVVRRKGTATIGRHVYRGNEAAFVFAETLDDRYEVTP